MDPRLASLAAGWGLALAGAAAGFLALWRVRWVPQAVSRQAREGTAALESALGVLQQSLGELRAQVEDLRAQPTPGPPLVIPARAGLNLNRRAQALRMCRRGQPAPEIAAALDIPLQEVELLLKVHRIVIRSI